MAEQTDSASEHADVAGKDWDGDPELGARSGQPELAPPLGKTRGGSPGRPSAGRRRRAGRGSNTLTESSRGHNNDVLLPRPARLRRPADGRPGEPPRVLP